MDSPLYKLRINEGLVLGESGSDHVLEILVSTARGFGECRRLHDCQANRIHLVEKHQIEQLVRIEQFYERDGWGNIQGRGAVMWPTHSGVECLIYNSWKSCENFGFQAAKIIVCVSAHLFEWLWFVQSPPNSLHRVSNHDLLSQSMTIAPRHIHNTLNHVR